MIQPSEMQYSSTLVFSLPLKRMPTPWRSTSSSKCGLRGSSDRRSGSGFSVFVGHGRALAALQLRQRASIRRTAVTLRCHHSPARRQSPARIPFTGGLTHASSFASCRLLSVRARRRLAQAPTPPVAPPPPSPARPQPMTQDKPEGIAAAPGTEGKKPASGTSMPAMVRAMTRPSTPAPAPGCSSTSRLTGARSRSTCWATSMSCRSRAARRGP